MLPSFGVRSVDVHREEFCVNNFYEMTDFIRDELQGIIFPQFQDLFLEQRKIVFYDYYTSIQL